MNTKTKEEEKQGLVVFKGDAESLIAKAIDRNVSVETMERLLAMRRELKAEWAKEEFDKAMSAFQSQCLIIKKTKGVKTDAGELAYKYAPLESIVDQVKDLLSKHGFSYGVNQPEAKQGYVKVAFTVKHKSGHSETSSVELPLGNKTRIMSQTQVEAAALTFAKRYAFCNAFGILTGDEDTDANTDQAEHVSKSAQHVNNGNGRITYRQSNFIRVLLKQKGYTEKDLLKKYEATSMAHITSKQASTIIENLQRLPDVDDAEREAEEIANDPV